MSIARSAAIAAAVLFLLLAAFQLALALGAPWGRAAYGGAVERPGTGLRIASAVAVLVWTGVALVVLRRSGIETWAPLPTSWLPIAIWVIVAYLAIGVVMNAISPSPLERAIWVPFILAAGALTIVVAVTSAAQSGDS